MKPFVALNYSEKIIDIFILRANATCSHYTHTGRFWTEEAFKQAFRQSQRVSLCSTSSWQEFNNSGVSLGIGNLPGVTCLKHICSENPPAHQVWSAAQSAAAPAVIVHAAPHSGAQCFTILIQRETFSQLLRLQSLYFAADKKKERKSMKPRINKTLPLPKLAPSFFFKMIM